MTNPARPQYQDVIDEAWGGQVADHVIRRYADNAERDADLAGLTAAELSGQTIIVAAKYQRHDGTAWLHAPYHNLIQRGEGFVALDGSSAFAITFPEPFANVNYSLIVANQNDWSSPCKYFLVSRNRLVTGCSVISEKADGTGSGAGAQCGFMWIACGAPAPVTGPSLDNPDATVGPVLYDADGRPIVREQNASERALCDEARAIGAIPPEGF